MKVEKTIVFWKDRDGKEGIKGYWGDCDFGGVYMHRRKPDLSKPFGHFILDSRKYGLVNEGVKEGSNVKYSFYEEM